MRTEESLEKGIEMKIETEIGTKVEIIKRQKKSQIRPIRWKFLKPCRIVCKILPKGSK